MKPLDRLAETRWKHRATVVRFGRAAHRLHSHCFRFFGNNRGWAGRNRVPGDIARWSMVDARHGAWGYGTAAEASAWLRAPTPLRLRCGRPEGACLADKRARVWCRLAEWQTKSDRWRQILGWSRPRGKKLLADARWNGVSWCCRTGLNDRPHPPGAACCQFTRCQ